MGRWLTICLMFLVFESTAHAERIMVPSALWEKPRSGDLVLAQPAVRQSVLALLAQPSARLLIYHDKHDETVLQAEELRAWLIALAVDGSRIELRQESEKSAGLNLELVGFAIEEKQNQNRGTP